jgi:hypothetical protein
MQIRIIARPIGEAPEWVRDAWIGLRLPLACPRKGDWPGAHVLTGPRTLSGQLWARLRGRGLTVHGYVVKTREAFEILAESHPEAAAWWHEHASYLLDGRAGLIFDEAACEPEEKG